MVQKYCVCRFAPIFVCFWMLTVGLHVWASEPVVPVSDHDWPEWRGHHQDGIVHKPQSPPMKWSDTENVVWKRELPGRSHGSPTVVADHVYVPIADTEKETQSVACFDRQTGNPLWSTVVHHKGLAEKMNERASHASSTVACDGERLFVNFLNRGAVYTTALDRNGKQLWQTKISDYIVHQGYGSSPAIYKSLVIVSADNKGGGAVCGLDRSSGDVVWRVHRPKKPNYASPVILHANDRDQLVFIGCELVSSFDPLTGEKLWETNGATTECVTSTVTDGTRVFSSGGYPKNHVAAIEADGSGTIAWEKPVRVYVPSMVIRREHLYAVTDAGVAMCWRTEDGEEMWKARLGGTFNACPVLVTVSDESEPDKAADLIFATNEEGTTFIYRATPQGMTLLGENRLGEDIFATPTFAGDQIFMRVAHQAGETRQEVLYCLGEP